MSFRNIYITLIAMLLACFHASAQELRREVRVHFRIESAVLEENFMENSEALKDLEALIEEAKAEAETLRDEIKTEMLNRNTEEMEAGQYIIRWTSVLSQRFDTTGFKKSHADLYKEFTKQVSSRRFSIA